MGELAIAGKHGRRKLVTTRRDKDATPAPDLVQRDFSAEGPDELWVGDITYVPTGEGWLFVASVLDVFSRRLVGWSIADHLRTELCLDALQAASASRGRLRFVGTKFHSDYVEVWVKPRTQSPAWTGGAGRLSPRLNELVCR
jgi:transposase InsO family protein